MASGDLTKPAGWTREVSKRAGLAVAYKPPLTRKNVFEAAPGIEPGYRALQALA